MLLHKLNEWALMTQIGQYLIYNKCLFKLALGIVMTIPFSVHINTMVSSVTHTLQMKKLRKVM